MMQQISAYQLPLDYPGAIFPSRLEWLCQPEQIEWTLCQLYYLNSWKQASQQILYADRQGLHEVQALVLEQAAKMGMMQAAMYVDSTRRFPGELLLDSVAENAARGVLIHMRGLRDPDIWPPFCPDGDRVYQQSIRPLYKRITGWELISLLCARTNCWRKRTTWPNPLFATSSGPPVTTIMKSGKTIPGMGFVCRQDWYKPGNLPMQGRETEKFSATKFFGLSPLHFASG
jgi:hypothetical protein